MNRFRIVGRAALLALLAVGALPFSPAMGQEQDVMIFCVCVTSTREEPITIFGIQVGTRTVTTTQCWYDTELPS